MQLSRAFYTDVVRPLLAGVPHSAALIGPGSEVLDCDTERSTDHDWGPRVLLFVPRGHTAAVSDTVTAHLPDTFAGYPTVFGSDRSPPRHGVHVTDTATWFRDRLGFDPAQPLTTLDWLATPWQRLAEVTGGEVFHDGLNLLEPARATLRWYPADLWRYILACQWDRIAESEAFPGRCGEAGDDLGSAVLTARLAADLQRLTLLMRRRYPPYAKWLGTAYTRLTGTAETGEALSRATAATGWREREHHLSLAYERTAALHNRLNLTAPLDPAVRPYHDRPFQVLGGHRYATALRAGITDPATAALPPAGSIDQFCDNTAVLTDPARARTAARAVLGL
ncbi:DUF4037 domain-containing protein [Microtetraspora sp. NBRC 13810]|uniref:DUF4037 domain-containing protein n=1 Tax=Microtetraspora sp. NBRC 13810 TaxID=3030990 RepID=UPI00255715AB|nr:DUF4037 domain-containing protein [Microtetraspora sp. NBRC 13810]